MFAVISLVKARYKTSWNSKGEENTPLLEELYNCTAMAWLQNVDIFAICHRYSEDSKSWSNGYCLYFHGYLESNYFSLLPGYPLGQTTIILAPNRFPASTLAPCAMCSSQSKFLLKMVRSCPFCVQNLPLVSDLIKNKIWIPYRGYKTLHDMALSLAPYHSLRHSSYSSYTSLLAVSQVH